MPFLAACSAQDNRLAVCQAGRGKSNDDCGIEVKTLLLPTPKVLDSVVHVQSVGRTPADPVWECGRTTGSRLNSEACRLQVGSMARWGAISQLHAWPVSKSVPSTKPVKQVFTCPAGIQLESLSGISNFGNRYGNRHGVVQNVQQAAQQTCSSCNTAW